MELAIAITALALNFLTLLFVFGYWKGKIDTKINTLWDVYVTSVLVRRTQMKTPLPNPIDIEQLGIIKHHSMGDLGYQIITKVKVAGIKTLAFEEHLSFGETLAALILTYLAKENKSEILPD